MTPPCIRRAGVADLDAASVLFDAYRSFYGQAHDLFRARSWLAERMAREESVLLLAERDGMTVGFTQLYRMFSSVRTGRLWILNDLFVDASARRCGTARALLDAAAAIARDDGSIGIMLETARDNEAARALYVAAGWSEDASQWYSLSFTSGSADAAG